MIRVIFVVASALMLATVGKASYSEEAEAQKAEVLKEWLAQHPLEPGPWVAKGDSQFCADVYQAFATASPDIKYVKPVLRTEDPEHPELERYRQCRNRDAEDITGLGYDYFGIDKRAHGFRQYRLDLDSNPTNGLEEYLYEEESPGSMVDGTTHYVRVNFDRCEIENILPAMSQEPIRSKSSWRGLNAMIAFRNKHYIYNREVGHLSLYPYAPTKNGFIQNALCIWRAADQLEQSDTTLKERSNT